MEFEGRPLRELLLDAIRYGEQPEVRARLDTAVDQALDRTTLQDLLEERQLVHDAMDASRVQRVREEMERAEARRLQPHYIESFFREAFRQLGGSARQREPRRYQVSHVPAPIRNRDRLIGISEPVLPRYERIVFEKPLVAPPGQPLAAFVCPGHPLLDAVIDLILERHRDLLKRGAVLVDERDHGTTPRVLFSIEHALQDAGVTRAGDRRVVSKRVLYVELDNDGVTRHLHYAPYLDYRPLADDEPAVDAFLERPECAWIDRDLEQAAQAYAVADVVPEHLAEVRAARLALIDKTEAAVKDRLTKEISYWDHRAAQLALEEGYSWRGEEKVYNPFDILLLFDTREFAAHWFETGTPTFLVDTLFRRRVSSLALDGMLSNAELLSTFDVDDMPTEALLFQTGYLTIERPEPRGAQMFYRLGYPNREVRQSLNRSLLNRMTGDASRPVAHSARLGYRQHSC